MTYNLAGKNAKKCHDFLCNTCNFKCSKKSNYDAHLTTRKHQILTNTYKILTKNAEKMPKQYTCECGKSYKHRQSLNNHRSGCQIILNVSEETDVHIEADPALSITPTSEIVTAMTNVMKDTMVEVVKEIVKKESVSHSNNISNSHNHTNIHNQTFNLQFFLNDTCKNAMNIDDFVKNLRINTDDFEQVGKLGYTEGISRLLIKGLNELDISQRPIHCSDVKREVIHIKEQDKWERDTPNQDKLKGVIKQISNKSMMVMDDYVKENPGCKDPQHSKNDLYLKCMIQACGPIDSDTMQEREFKKISKKVATHTIIHKQI
jgi:hypothetical protein